MISYRSVRQAKIFGLGFHMKECGQWPRINIPKLVGRYIGDGCDSAKDTGWQACDRSISYEARDRGSSITSEQLTSRGCVILQKSERVGAWLRKPRKV